MKVGPKVAATLVATAALVLPAAAAAHGTRAFDHAGTFHVPANLLPGEPETTVTSAEIVDATPDGRTLVYTDSPAGRIGFIDVRRPGAPRPGGALAMGGEPTSVAVVGDRALVAVNTSPSFAAPSGELAIVDIAARTVVRRIALAGQPDSIDISPDRRYAAIVIENERDEDVADGLIPQAPAGLLQVLDLRTLTLRSVDLTGLAAVAPDDPEPEFVDINGDDEAVVSLQENNHLAIVDLRRARVLRHFSAGSATVSGIDAVEDDLGPQGAGHHRPLRHAHPAARARRGEVDRRRHLRDRQRGRLHRRRGRRGRQPLVHAVQRPRVRRVRGGRGVRARARARRALPEGRSANKGNEPEGLEIAQAGGRTLLLVGSERANAGRRLRRRRPPAALPPGAAHRHRAEGIRYLPARELLAVSRRDGRRGRRLRVRSLVTLYALGRGRPSYPDVESADDAAGLPIPWTALSGLSGDARDPHAVWAVSDSALAQAYLYRIDVGRRPARIERADRRRRRRRGRPGDRRLRPRGRRGPPRGRLLAGERGSHQRGQLTAEPARAHGRRRPRASRALRCRRASWRGATSSGFEGVAVTGTQTRGDETVWAVIQREWADDAPGTVKLARYAVGSGRWTFARYPLDAVESPSGGWVGLSELALSPGGKRVAIVERDDRIALDARVKRVYGVDPADPSVDLARARTAARHGPQDAPARRPRRPRRTAASRCPTSWRGLGVTTDGRVWLATDNDGVDENYGETLLFGLGPAWRAFDR